MSHKILIICLFSSLCAWSSANNLSRAETSHSWIKKNFMILNSKFDFLNKEFEHSRANGSTGNDAICVESSINSTLIIANAIQQLQAQLVKLEEKLETKFEKKDKIEEKIEKLETKFEKIDEKIEKLETKFEKMEKLETKFEKVDKIDVKFKKMDKIDEKIVKIDEKIEKIETKFEKMDKIDEKLDDILWQLINRSQEEELLKGEAVSEMTSQVSQMKGQLDRVESQLSQQKARFFNACDPDPCINGGSCVSISGGKDFTCDECPWNRSGVHCEKLEVKCEGDDKCWVHKGTMYVVLEPKSNWTEAERKCQSMGMGLIMPKEKDQTEFIVKKLTAVHGSFGPYFWMGLTKAEGGSGWRWSDGSELGSYIGGRSDFKRASDNKYGHLMLGNGDQMWDWDGPTYSNAYPLCEKSV